MRAIFNEDFKLVTLDESVAPDESVLEFAYDTSANPSKATLLGIARRLRIKGNYDMKPPQLIEAIDAKLKSIRLKEKEMSSVNETIQNIIKENNEAGTSEDEIIIAIVQSGVGYKDAIGLYEKNCILLGIKAKPMKPAERNTAVAKLLKKMRFKAPKEWQGVIDTVNKLLEELEGVTASTLLTSVRAYARDNEIELPKPVKEKKEKVDPIISLTNFVMDNMEGDDPVKALTEHMTEKKVGKGRVKVMLAVQQAMLERASDDDEEDEAEAA